MGMFRNLLMMQSMCKDMIEFSASDITFSDGERTKQFTIKSNNTWSLAFDADGNQIKR